MVVTELFHAIKRLKADFEWLAEAKYFEKVDSTQKRIVQFLPKTGEGAVLIIGESQSKATGRNGRPWVSPEGGIWITLAFPMKAREISQSAPFSIVCAHVVVNALKEVNNLQCEVKWPNDVLYEGKKVAGILCSTVKKFKNNWFLVGIGINVNNDLPASLKKEATSIKLIRNQTQGRSRLIESIMGTLWSAWGEFDRTGFGPYQKGVEGQLVGVGKSTRILIGKTKVEGTVVGIDPQGGLLLKSGSDTKTIRAGEIVGQPA